jgi:galactokinase
MIIKVESPGRINLIGEHTDYNGGHVLPGAIDKKIIFEIYKTDNNNCEIKSDITKQSLVFNINKIEKSNTHWHNYLLGTIDYFKKKDNKITAFKCSIKSNLPIGAGISSSSALISGFSRAIIELFDLNYDKSDIVKIVSYVERNFIGLQGGIMDQFTINYGLKDNLILLNCSNSNYKYIKFKSESIGILLLNTNIKHSLIDSAYNDRVNECQEAESILNSHFNDSRRLANYTLNELNQVKDKLDIIIFNRAYFVIDENERTVSSSELLKQSNFKDFGELMYKSHKGLKDLYEVSCSELDYIVDFTKKLNYVLGSRMMGGGFGGCTVNLIEKNHINTFIKDVSKNYLKTIGKNLTPIKVNIGNGLTYKKIK